VTGPADSGSSDHGSGATADGTDRRHAEDAAVAYWRGVAADRRVEAARVQRRPIVRAAIAVDRRTRRLQDRVGAATGRGRAAVDRLRARAAGGVGPAPAAAVDIHRAGADSSGMGLTVAIHPIHDEGVPAVDIVVLVSPDVRPEPGSLDALAAALVDPDIGAAVPCSLLPGRPLVRSAGSAIDLVDGVPHPRALPAPDGPTGPVDLAASGAIAVRRADLERVGGVDRSLPGDAASADLALRLAAAGAGRTVAVRTAHVVEPAPVRPVEVRERPPSDGDAWRALVGRHGATIRRTARSSGHPVRPRTGWSATVTTATPSRKIAAHSGDWHYAGCFVDALERAGIDAIRQTIAEVNSTDGRTRDVHIVLRGLEPVERTPGQAHVLWVISHPEALTVDECDAADLILVASERFAAHLAGSTSTPVEVFEQATDPTRFRPDAAPGPRRGIDVVANTRGVRRASVDAALATGHRPTIHGLGWDGLVDPSLVADTYVGFDDLPALYASSAVVLNDHWDTMRLWGFVSNRILDATAAGATVVSDHLPEIVERFEGAVPTWETPEELGTILDEIASDPAAAAERTDHARSLVLAHHTFDHRVRELDELLHRHGLHPAP
jgi:hypothetical protein